MSSPDSKTRSLLLVVGLFLVLGVLAVLQYRWTGELGEAERERMRRTAAESSRRLSADLDGRLASVATGFRFDPGTSVEAGDRVAGAFARLSAEDARLVRNVWLVPLDDEPRVRQLDTATLEWSEGRAPDWVVRLTRRGAVAGRGFRFQPFVPEGPALVLPSGQPRVGGPDERGAGRLPGGGPSELVVIELDRKILSGEVLPDLVRLHFGDDDVRNWDVRILDRRTGSVLCETASAPHAGPPEVETAMLGAGLVSAIAQHPGGIPLAGAGGRGAGSGPGAPPGELRGAGPAAGAWILEVRHRDGSLRAVVETSRRRNLALGAGVLLLLLAGGLIIIANAHRARELAEQQLEFVAAITHELNTPIAAISSAGQNLADGVVQEPEQVKRYGTMIAREGRRLSAMVDHVLEFAGIRSGPRAIDRRPHAVTEIVGHALSATAFMIEESGVTIERELRDGDRVIECDGDALARALANLVSNAIKYRGASSRVVVRTHVDDRAREVVFSVEDEGLGLTAEDRARVFEPFVRGASARKGAIRGSGLGLSIVRNVVESHGGRVTVDSTPGRGSVFSIRIPVE